MMKNNKVRNFSIGIVLCLLMAASALAATVSVSPASTSKAVGKTFTVTVTATQMSSVLGYSFRINYDATKIGVTSVAGGNYISSCTTPFTSTANNSGSVGVDSACMGQTVSSGTTLGTISFVTLASGTTDLDLADVSIDVGIPSSKANITTSDGSVTITGGTTTTVATTTTTTLPGTVAVSIDNARAKVNAQFTVSVKASSVSNVLAYTFRVAYDSSDLEVINITVGNYLSGCTTPTNFITNTAGVVGLDAACLGQGVSSGSTLATIKFKGKVADTSALTLQNVEITLANQSTMPISLSNGVVTIVRSTSSRDDFAVTIPSAAFANAPIKISVTDSDTKDGVEKAAVDVYLNSANGKKVSYGTTDNNGSFTFSVTAAGKYVVVIAKSGYRDLSETLTVSAGSPTTTVAATTTTVKATTTTAIATTTVPEETTTTQATTTTVQVTTTTMAPVTTTQPVEVTTTTKPAASGGNDMSTLLIGIVVLIIVVALVYFMMKGKGKGAAKNGSEKAEKLKNGKSESK